NTTDGIYHTAHLLGCLCQSRSVRAVYSGPGEHQVMHCMLYWIWAFRLYLVHASSGAPSDLRVLPFHQEEKSVAVAVNPPQPRNPGSDTPLNALRFAECSFRIAHAASHVHCMPV